jgi:ribonuclease BN (tRNA processing enzyme)
MSDAPTAGMRVHFYGVQGSGSTSPTRAERRAFQELTDYELLRQIFDELGRRADPVTGKNSFSVEEVLGGPPDHRRLLEFRRRFEVVEPRMYGGWTTCVRVETPDGYDLVFDCGSGFRNCAKELQAKWNAAAPAAAREVHVFGSHSHLDHTEGFDQAPVCFDPRNTLHIYGNRQFLRSLDSNLGIFTRYVSEDLRGVHTPLFYAIMPAKFVAHELRDPRTPPPPGQDGLAHAVHDLTDPVRVGQTTVRAFEVFHPAPCLAYRVEHGGKVFVFCTDHELRHGPDEAHAHQKASLAAERRVVEHATGADLLYRDGQYLRVEYDGLQGIGNSGPVPRLDWGHSCIEDIVEMARASRVKRTLIGHHDPNRDWSERNWLDETLTRSSLESPYKVELAQAETAIDL